jgi:HSP20 family molecular chaperone IbpA
MTQGDKRDSDQVQRFIDAAHKIGADEDKAQFEAQLAKIAAHKPEPKPLKKKRPNKKLDDQKK